MKIEINKLVSDKIDFEFLEKFAKKILSLDKLGTKISKKFSELSIAIVDDEKIKALNKKYLNKDRITDVLAFDYGEIIICLDQAKRQAKELNLSTEQELAILLIHGILHLAGYNDRIKKDKEKMFKQQNKTFKEVWQKIKS